MKSLFSFRVFREEGRWFFPWAFAIYNGDGEFVYGEHHIESRRGATKDAEDLVARLSDGRIWIHPEAGLIHA